MRQVRRDWGPRHPDVRPGGCVGRPRLFLLSQEARAEDGD